jgi:hypothetical protein
MRDTRSWPEWFRQERNHWGFTLWPLSVVFLAWDTYTFFGTLKAGRVRHARTRQDLWGWQKLPYIVLPGGGLPVDPAWENED